MIHTVASYITNTIAFIEVTPLERILSRMDIECPGDIIAYNCFVMSNSENVQLTWRVALPEEKPFNVTYDGSSAVNIEERIGISDNSSAENNIGMSITTTLNDFMADEYIESTIVFTVLKDLVLNGTELDCTSEVLGTNSIVVLVNISGT